MTYVQSWNLNVQQQLAGSWLFSAGYLGNATVHLWDKRSANPSLILTQASHPQLFTGPNTCVLEGRSYTPCNQSGNINQRRQLRLWATANNNAARLEDTKTFSFIDWHASEGTATFNGLLTSIRGTIAGVNVNANHTWSHCISDKNGGGNPADTANVGRDRGNCSYDRRHIFNLSAVATTPRFQSPGLRAVASDWQLSVIYQVSSAAYLTITSGQDRALTGNGNQRVDQLTGNVYQDKSGTLGSQLLSRAAFAQPAQATYGNMGTFSVPGFGSWNLSMALARAFRIRETQQFEIRAEAFNVTNSARPSNPSGNFNSGTFGRITSIEDPRIMQFALKYVF